MTVISKRVFRPMPGKSALALSRVRRLGECLGRLGGRVRIAGVAWGDGARDVHLYGVFETMQAGAKAFAALAEDADAVKLRSESENDPASVWEGPEVWRAAFGQPRPDYPVMLQREYSINRRNLKRAVDLLPEVQALDANMPILGVVPVVSGDMARLMVGYYAKTLVDLGEGIDRVGMSDAFQAIVLRAAELGTLTRARVIVTM
jgi:hypothetical protein